MASSRPRMSSPDTVALDVVLEREHPEMPAFVVVPASAVAAWGLTSTTTVEATLDGVELGRVSLKRWDDKRWFLELRRDRFEAVAKALGKRARLVLARASTELPKELQALVDGFPEARSRWEGLTQAQQRMLREAVFELKTSAARDRRARKDLLPQPRKRPPKVAGLSTVPKSLLVRIVGSRLPGRVCGPYSEVRVGLAQRVGCDPEDGVPADVREAVWETTIEVLEKNGLSAFKGAAVNGPPHERFLYLTWTGRLGGAREAMFRRAKLRLDAIPPTTLAKAVRSGRLIGRLDLTAPDGMPVCASVRPPAIVWSA